MPAKIFIAAPWINREAANDLGDKLQYQGFHITSKWHDPNWKMPDDLGLRASVDLRHIDDAEACVLLDLRPSSGKYIEAGYALAKRKKVFWWLPSIDNSWRTDSPLYSYLDTITIVNSWITLQEALFKWIEGK